MGASLNRRWGCKVLSEDGGWCPYGAWPLIVAWRCVDAGRVCHEIRPIADQQFLLDQEPALDYPQISQKDLKPVDLRIRIG